MQQFGDTSCASRRSLYPARGTTVEQTNWICSPGAPVLSVQRRERYCRSGRRTKHPMSLQPACRNAWLLRGGRGLHATCPGSGTTRDRSRELSLRLPDWRGRVRSDSNGELPPGKLDGELRSGLRCWLQSRPWQFAMPAQRPSLLPRNGLALRATSLRHKASQQGFRHP